MTAFLPIKYIKEMNRYLKSLESVIFSRTFLDFLKAPQFVYKILLVKNVKSIDSYFYDIYNKIKQYPVRYSEQFN